MNRISKLSRMASAFLLSFLVLFSVMPAGHATSYTAGLPVLITSAGQCPDAFVVKVLFDRSKIAAEYDEMAEVEKLKGMKTLILVLGGSAKGLGAAGIDEDEELARIKRIIDKAKELKISTVGIHIGGEARRGPLSTKFIEASAPICDYLIVKEDGNADGYFTKLGTTKNIPVTVIKDSNEIGGIFKAVFGIK